MPERDHAAPASERTARLAGVLRRWRRAEVRCLPLERFEEGPRESLARLCALVWIALLPLAGVVDAHRTTTGADHGESARRAALAVAALAALVLVHGWQVNRLVACRSRSEANARSWVRGLRWLFASVPLVGWLVIPWWRRLDLRQPVWAFRERAAVMAGFGSSRRRVACRALPRAGVGQDFAQRRFLALVVVSIVVPNLTVYGPLAGESAMWLATVGSVAIHLVGFSCALVHLWFDPARSANSPPLVRWSPLAAGFWLAPMPMAPFLTLVAYAVANDPVSRSSTLVAQALASRRSTGRFASWRSLRLALRSAWWGLPWGRRVRGRPSEIDAVTESGTVEANVAWLERFKALTLFCDAACLSWVLAWLGDHAAGGSSFARPILALLALPALALGLAGTAGMLIGFFTDLLRSRDRLPGWVRGSLPVLMAAAHLGFVAGLFLGEGLYRHDLEQVGGVVFAAGATGAVRLTLPRLLSIVVALPPESTERDRSLSWWTLGFCVAGIWGLGLVRPESSGPVSWPELMAVVALGSVSGMIVGFNRLPWLLHPCEPRQLAGRGLPARLRRRVVVLAVSAVVPGAGLVVPWWSTLRRGLARHDPATHSEPC